MDCKFCGKGTKRGRICNTCKSRIYREKYPIKAAYDHIKYRAKERKKPFKITLEYFTEFCYKTELLASGRRKHAEGFTVDCIINELGYVEGNLQKLTLSENSKKSVKRIEYDWQQKEFYVSETIKSTLPDPDIPF